MKKEKQRKKKRTRWVVVVVVGVDSNVVAYNCVTFFSPKSFEPTLKKSHD